MRKKKKVLSVLLRLLPPVLLFEVQGVLMSSSFGVFCYPLINTTVVVHTIYNVKRIFQQENEAFLSMVICTYKLFLLLRQRKNVYLYAGVVYISWLDGVVKL